MASAPTKPLKSPYITHLASFPSQNSPTNSVEEAKIYGQEGSDTYTVNFGNLSGPVTVKDSATSGTNILRVNGTAEGDAIIKIPGLIAWGEIVNPAYPETTPVTQTVAYSGVERPTLAAGDGDDYIRDYGASAILGGPGNDTIIIDATLPGNVLIDGEDGSDTFIVNCGNLVGAVQVTDSGTSSSEVNSLAIQGTLGDNAFVVTNNEVTWGTQTVESISYSSITNLTLVTGLGNNTVEIQSTAEAGVTVNAQGGTDTYMVDLGSLAGPVTVANPTNTGSVSVVIVGTPESDAITLSGTTVQSGAGATTQTVQLGTTVVAALTVDGGAGNDQITVGGLTALVEDLTLAGGDGSNTFTIVDLASSPVESLDIHGGTGTGNDQVQIQGELPPSVQMEHVAPIVSSLSGPAAGLRGQTLAFAGSFADPDANAWSATVDYGDGSAVQPLNLKADKTFNFSHAYANFGGYPLTVTVTDSDGGVGTGTSIVTVNYASAGFLAPLSQNMYFALGRTIPIKFQLTDASGSLVTGMSAVQSISVTGPEGRITPPPAAGSTGWRNDGAQYIYNWQTAKTLAQGPYVIVVTLADGSTIAKDIQLVSSVGAAKLTADSATAAAGGATAGALLGGDVALLVDNQAGQFSADELVRVQDAIAQVNSVVGPYGVTIYQVDPAYAASANVVVQTSATSAVGGYADGVLGCTTDLGEITLIQGWSWYTGADAGQIAAGQYDFQTAVTHELGHALGLGHSAVSSSVMYATLSSGMTSRALAVQDLNVAGQADGPSALRVAVPHAARIDAFMLAAWGSPRMAPSDRTVELKGGPGGTLPLTIEDHAPGDSSLDNRDSRVARVRDQFFQSLATDKDHAVVLDRWLSSARVGKREAETIGSLSRLLTDTLGHNELADEAEAGFLDEELLEMLALTS